MLYQTARHSRAQLCGPGAVLRTGRQDLCGSRCSVGIRQKEERPPRAPLSQLLCRCGAVAADQVCALVSCKTGLCSVLLSQSPGPFSLETCISSDSCLAVSPCGKASFMVWNNGYPIWPCSLSNSFLFLSPGSWGAPVCSHSRYHMVVHWGQNGPLVSLACPSWEWLPACPTTFCLSFSLGQNAASLTLYGALWTLGAPSPNTHAGLRCQLMCSLTPRTRALAVSEQGVARD